MMDDSKRAAKAFVDQYFPVKERNPKSSDVLGDIFPPRSMKVGFLVELNIFFLMGIC